MLDSAVNPPMNIKYYVKEENLFQLAANLAEKIMKNHIYQDGNKRTALLAADMFLMVISSKSSLWLLMLLITISPMPILP